MTGQVPGTYDSVGPVLQSGPVADVSLPRSRNLNQEVIVVDRGAYVRVSRSTMLCRNSFGN